MTEHGGPENHMLTDFERALLRSAGNDEPADGATRRAAVALGISAGVLASSSGAGAAAAGATSALAKSSLIAVALKPLFIGIVGGACLAGGSWAVHRGLASREVAPPAPSSAALRQATHRERASLPRVRASADVAGALTAPKDAANRQSAATHKPGETAVRPEPQLSTEDAPGADLGAREANSGSAPPLPPAMPAGPGSRGALPPVPDAPRPTAVSIAEEIRSVDRAREALRLNRPADALLELDRYRRNWPHGALFTEVSVLHIQAELMQNLRGAALREARAFLAVQPTGPYAARVRALFSPSELP